MDKNNLNHRIDHSPTPDLKRRDLLKFGAMGGLGAAATIATSGVALAGAGNPSGDTVTGAPGHLIKEHDDFPLKVASDYRPFHPKNTAFSDFHLRKIPVYPTPMEGDDSKPGFTKIDVALDHAAWEMEKRLEGYAGGSNYNTGFYNWDNPVNPKRTQFKSKAEAANAIKRAARMFGADLVGITHQDDRWDYEAHYNSFTDEEMPWEGYPFKPKTVIVMALEQDYEGIATAPSSICNAVVGERYSHMVFTAYGVSCFLRQLGYNAVASGNDSALSVPYALAAGLGETSRMGMMVTHTYGPRVRIMKVFTDLEFVEYDKPITFGVKEFCERCMRCADACPGEAISRAEKPTLYPTEEERSPTQAPGIEKWWNDGAKCLQYWADSHTSCSTCVTACPYNKPDFWHHRAIETLNAFLPGPVHEFTKEMDAWFGFGNTFDEEAAKKFWDPAGRKYNGRS